MKHKNLIITLTTICTALITAVAIILPTKNTALQTKAEEPTIETYYWITFNEDPETDGWYHQRNYNIPVKKIYNQNTYIWIEPENVSLEITWDQELYINLTGPMRQDLYDRGQWSGYSFSTVPTTFLTTYTFTQEQYNDLIEIADIYVVSSHLTDADYEITTTQIITKQNPSNQIRVIQAISYDEEETAYGGAIIPNPINIDWTGQYTLHGYRDLYKNDYHYKYYTTDIGPFEATAKTLQKPILAIGWENNLIIQNLDPNAQVRELINTSKPSSQQHIAFLNSNQTAYKIEEENYGNIKLKISAPGYIDNQSDVILVDEDTYVKPQEIYEAIDLGGLMLQVLGMPFTFINKAFNLTLFPGSQYEINFANIIKGMIAILTLLFIFNLFKNGLGALGDYKDNRESRKIKREKRSKDRKE